MLIYSLFVFFLQKVCLKVINENIIIQVASLTLSVGSSKLDAEDLGVS
jgi:hypothetical protein